MIPSYRHPFCMESTPSDRRGIVLIIVMVVVVMISLAGFGFVASMANANKVVHLRGEQLQMENAIVSAEEFLKQHLSRPVSLEATPRAAVAQEELMRGIVVADDDGPHGRVRFTIMAPRFAETPDNTWQYGLQPESARLDLRTVMDWETRLPGAGKKALLALPGITDSIADALLDWMDADTVPRLSGAEDDYYAALNPPCSPRNGIPESLEELLLVKGITRSLLFGRDANQNHRLDLEEQFSGLVPEQRETSSERQWPWSELLTLYSSERNQTRDGQPRINLNQMDLQRLHQQLSLAFDVKLAIYIVLARQFGSVIVNGPTTSAADLQTVQLNFNNPGRLRFRSALEVLQNPVMYGAPSGSTGYVLSPVPTEREPLDTFLSEYCDRVTLTDALAIRGRINVNLAPAEVLQAIPGIDKALAEQIVAARTSNTRDSRRDQHPCWLLTEGLVSLMKMKEIYPHLTTGGDVYRTQIVAFSETSRLSQRVEVVLDASRRPVRRLFWKDLQVLGRGYPWDVLDTPGGVSHSGTGAFDATPLGH